MARFSLQALFVCACVLLPRVSAAQGGEAASGTVAATNLGAARESFREGVLLAEQLRWADAERAFARSADMAPSATCLLNLAVTRFELKLPLEGLSAIDRIDQLVVPITPQQAERARAVRQQLEQIVATVRLELNPREAAVSLDGSPLPAAARGGSLRLNPGHHVLLASAPGYLDARLPIELAVGERRTAQLVLAPTPASAARTAPSVLPGPRVAAPVVASRVNATPVVQASLFSKPWFWVGAGAVVLASVVVTGVALSSTPGATSGSEGHVF